MRGDMGVFIVVGTALMFLAFAAMAVSVASQPDLEDAFYNQYMLFPSFLQSASDAVSACTGYAIVQALDNSPDPHHNISSVTQSAVLGYFNNCTSTAFSRVDQAVVRLGPVATLTRHISVACVGPDGECNVVSVIGYVSYDFNVDANLSGVRIQKQFAGKLNIAKRAVVLPTGQIWIGNPATPADDRNVYRILVYDLLLGRVEVNGVWPR